MDDIVSNMSRYARKIQKTKLVSDKSTNQYEKIFS